MVEMKELTFESFNKLLISMIFVLIPKKKLPDFLFIVRKNFFL